MHATVGRMLGEKTQVTAVRELSAIVTRTLNSMMEVKVISSRRWMM
jgi:hypothetical protein